MSLGMRIAFLSFYSGVVYRGAETFVDELAARLCHKHEVTVYQSGPKTKKIYRVVQVPLPAVSNVEIVKYGLLRRFFLDHWSLQIKRFTLRALQEIRGGADIIIPVNGGWMTMLCKIWTIVNGTKMVISGHSGIGWDDRINLLIRPHCFVALSEFQKKWARKNSFGTKIETIPNGIDLEKFSPNVAPMDFVLPGKVVLCVAALEKDKRVDLVIEAVSQLSGVSLVVVGRGHLEGELQRMGEAKLLGRFKIISVPYEKMPHVYGGCDVMTMVPVSSESFGIVYLEAMATNKPVVAAADPIRKEIVGDGGILVNPTNIEEYTQALQFALTSSWNNKPRLAAEKFSWETVAKSYESLLTSLVKKN